MSIERIIVNGRELTAFDMPAEPSKEYSVRVDDSNEVEVAELGRGTCRMELQDLRGPAYTDVYVCSECGGEVMVGTVMGVSDVPKWCPWCGRKVEA